MKKTIRASAVLMVLGALMLTTLLVTGCRRNDGKTLYLYNWTYYTPDSVIEKFEKEYGVRVVYDDYASNEDMFAKLRAGGKGYDIVIPSGDYVSIMMKEGMLAEIDLSLIPNARYVRPDVLARATYDTQMKYHVPYFMGAAGVAVNKNRVSNYGKSWSIFSRKDLAGRMSMLNDMREVLGDALAYLGYSVNSTDDAELEAAFNLVNNEWKPNLVKFDAEGFAKSFSAGEFWVVQGYAESVFEEIPEDQRDTVDFFIPVEGGPMYLDSMCIPKGHRNYELAHKFIDFILRPENYAEFLDTFGFPATIHTEAGALMTVEPWYQVEDLANCELKEDLGADLQKYNTLWERIRFTD